ncbi:hypothetical protein [Coralloluteibacterium stylophorae]|uniref:Glycosyltransferase family 1 protein n=1 Tax=Coralloluteibacterium stylophorae TaxID=1776034 RepID=A0A8J8AXS1_9GAMM|nr:hypothetical protein [Coralloluteibacterium stylophorae]MBS7457830.1 hypothetical protein [Coralloluteibacterium stylophorae]
MSGPRLWFHRDFGGYTGGHGKVSDYFRHALALGWDARVHFAAGSLTGPENPWHDVPERIEPVFAPQPGDVLFLAGLDWRAVPPDALDACEVVNLIQHVRHAEPADPRFAFLSRRATRICVSEPVFAALVGIGRTQGPLFTIPAAVDLAEVAAFANRHRPPTEGRRIFVDALKQPDLGREIARALARQGWRVDLVERRARRDAYLVRMAAADRAILLPHAAEGFYLPGLEALAMRRPLVLPAFAGAGAYARHEETCLMPAMESEAIVVALARLDDEALRERLVARGAEVAAGFDLPEERAAFAAVLEQVREGVR